MGNICCTDEKSKPNIFSDNEDTFLYGSDQIDDNANSPLDNTPESNREEAVGNTQPAGNINILDGNDTTNTAYAQAEAERQRALQEEQARLALIVSTAGRDMISLSSRSGGLVGSGCNLVASMNVGGSNGGIYYDPAYAATVAQELIHGHEGKGLLALSKDIESNEDLKKEMSSLVVGTVPVDKTCVEDGMGAVQVLSSRINYSEDLKATFISQQSRDGVSNGSGSGTIITGGTGGNFEDMDLYFEDIAERFLSSALCTKERLFQGVGPIVENLP